MFILDINHHGRKLLLRFQRDDGSEYVVETWVQHNGRNFVLFSNAEALGQAKGNDFYKYKYVLPNQQISQELFHDRLREVTLVSNERELDIIQLKSTGSFRRVYKREDSMVYVGPIVKDSDHCKRPANIITIIDAEALKARGWEKYKRETPAEERVKERSVRL